MRLTNRSTPTATRRVNSSLVKVGHMYFHIGTKSDFENTYIEAVGRSLCIAQNFESNCRSLAILLDVKTSFATKLDGSDFNALLEKLSRRMLGGAIRKLAVHIPLPLTIEKLLENAATARNYIAHDSMKIFLDPNAIEERLTGYLVVLRDNVSTITKADEMVAAWYFGISEEQPVTRAGYADDIEKWVFGNFSREDFENVE